MASAGSRVLMLLQNNPYPHDSRVSREARALSAAGHSVTVISPKRRGQSWREEFDGVLAYRFPMAPAGDSTFGYLLEYGVALCATWFLALYIYFRHGFDVIHAHNPPDLFALVAAPYKLLGVQFVFDHHDLAPEMYLARFGGQGSRSVTRALLACERFTFRLADRVIATNDSYRRVAIERGGVAPERVAVVRNGPDLARFKPAEPDAEFRSSGKLVIGYVGEMGVQDGIDYLLRALKHLLEDLEYDGFIAVLIGTGTDKPRLERLARELGLDPWVRFTGRVTDEELLRLLSAADVCVCPDPKNEFTDASTMIKVTEYMALAKPIVAFDLTEHRVTAGEAALYATANDELDFARRLLELAGDPALRRQLGDSGRRRLESGLTWAHSVPHLLDVFDGLRRAREGRAGAAWRA